MTSKNWFSKEGLKEKAQHGLWATALSGLGFFLSMMLPALVTIQNTRDQLETIANFTDPQQREEIRQVTWESAVNSLGNIVGGNNPFVKVAFVVLAVACGVAMFAYLHSRQKVDFYHSLPISRSRLFIHNFVSGVLYALPMYFVFLILTTICIGAMGFGEAINGGSLFYAVVNNLICFLLIYALTVLTTIVCGNTIITLLLWLWVMFSPLLTRALQIALCGVFFQSYVEYLPTSTWRLSPVVQFFAMNGSEIIIDDVSAVPTMILYAVLAVLATVLAWFLFKIRKSERCGTALAFTPMKIPVKVYMCLFMGAAFALLFYSISQSDRTNKMWLWGGMIFGVVVFHAIIEIIYAFDFRAIFSKLPQMGIILAVLAAVFLVMQFDVLGFETWIPNENNIAATSISDYHRSNEANLQSSENISAICQLHEYAVNWQKQYVLPDGTISDALDLDYTNKNSWWDTFTFVYRMKGGAYKARKYNVALGAEQIALVEQITNSAEYKQTAWQLFQYDFDEMDENNREPVIMVYNNTTNVYSSSNRSPIIQDREKVQELLDIMREDALNVRENGAPLLRIKVCSKEKDNDVSIADIQLEKFNDRFLPIGDVYITDKYTKTLAYLKQNFNLEPVKLSADNVESVCLRFYDYAYPEEPEESADVSTTESYSYDIDLEQALSVYITDPAEINRIVNGAINRESLEMYSGSGVQWGEYSDVFSTEMAQNCETTVQFKSADGQTSDSPYFQIMWERGKAPNNIIDRYQPTYQPTK